MGGGGSYYDRDVTDRRRVSRSRGYSDVAESRLSSTQVHKSMRTKKRRISCAKKNPIVYAFDVTGSMGSLPKVIYDKMPMIAGQLVENKYLQDPAISLAAVGDAVCDDGPIQIGDFCAMRKLDDWLERVWLEGGGGGQGVESYELTAYFYLKYCDVSKAEQPFLLFTGDEGFREDLYASDLNYHFGGRHKDTTAKVVFKGLLDKFKGNVFLIHKRYGGGDAAIVRQWQRVLGKERVILLPEDKAIADVTLGLFAIMTGSRTLDEYCEDLRTRKDINTGKADPQSPQRIKAVREALSVLTKLAPKKRRAASTRRKSTKAPRKTARRKGPKKTGGKKSRPGRF